MSDIEKVAEALRIVAGKMQKAYDMGQASQTVSLQDLLEMMLAVADKIDPIQ